MIETDFDLLACSAFGTVVVGRKWYRMLPTERDAIVAHEQAHIAMRHTRARVWWLLTGQWRGLAARCRQQEFDADRAATLLGHGIGLLNLLGRAHNTPASDFHPSHQERMSNIRKWMSNGNA